MVRIRIVLASLLLAGTFTAAQAQDTYTLKYVQLKPGDVTHQHTSNYFVGTVGGKGGASQNMTQKVDQWLKIECLDVDADGTATIRMTFERMAMAVNAGPMTVSCDSAAMPTSQPAANPGQAILRGMIGSLVGKSLHAKVTSQGKPIEISGVKEMMTDAVKNLPGGQMIAKMLEGMFTEDSLQENWFSGIEWLPAKPVHVGDTWESVRRIKMASFGEMVMKSKNKLLSVATVDGKRVAKVAFTINMEIGSDSEGIDLPGARGKMKTKMTSTGGSGSWMWDLDRGRMIQLKTSAPMDIDVTMTDPAKPDETLMTIAQKLVLTTKMEITDSAFDIAAPTTQPAGTATLTGTKSAAPSTQPAATKP